MNPDMWPATKKGGGTPWPQHLGKGSLYVASHMVQDPSVDSRDGVWTDPWPDGWAWAGSVEAWHGPDHTTGLPTLTVHMARTDAVRIHYFPVKVGFQGGSPARRFYTTVRNFTSSVKYAATLGGETKSILTFTTNPPNMTTLGVGESVPERTKYVYQRLATPEDKAHHVRARELLRGGGSLAAAQVHATLAVAEELSRLRPLLSDLLARSD